MTILSFTRPPSARALKVATAVGVLLMGETLPQSAVAGSGCAPAATAKEDVLVTLGHFSAALRAGNTQLLQQTTATDFLAYDIGAPLTGSALMNLIQGDRATGAQYDWNLTEVRPQVDCNLALVFGNQGALRPASAGQLPQWLAIAALKYEHWHWRVMYVYSMREALTQLL
jgi:hypothetical protein